MFTVDFGDGTRSQVTAAATYRATSIGCKTATPTRVARMPVMIGKVDPPICPMTNTKGRAVEWMVGGNSFEATEMP